MSKWRERLNDFLGGNPKPKLTMTDNRVGDSQSSVIVSATLGESQKKIRGAVEPSGPIIKTSSQDFLGEILDIRTANYRQLESDRAPLASGLTVWDLLRSRWPALLKLIRDAQDTEGKITVTAVVGGDVQDVRLDRTQALAATLNVLTTDYPDPLEVFIRAKKGDHLVNRSRLTRTMIPGRVIA